MNRTLIIALALGWTAFDPVKVLAQASVEILRPNSSDRLQPGTNFRIVWRAQGLRRETDWNFFLSTNNVQLGLLDGTTAIDDGGGYWHADVTVPNEVRPNSGVLTYVRLPSSCNYTLRIHEDGTEAGDISDVFCLGSPVVSVRVSQVDVCWTSRSNRTYQVQYRSALTTNVWTNLGASVQGNGSTNCITDAVNPNQPQRYYRVEELP
jgi:hypothetical protein